jgi:predicted CXXCH cytochrome family protein
LIAAAASAASVLLAALCLQLLSSGAVTAPPSQPRKEGELAAFVGSETCAGCHAAEARAWRGSQHRHAMDHATGATVLGDFSGTTFEYAGVRSRFFREGGKFLIETDGPDGKLATFEAKYTFGIAPLQQYLVEFPDGRLQALSIAWDSRSREEGGQRWFHLYPGESVGHDDVLHWTRLNQNWNSMCAECHSTGLRKNYDAASDRFATRFAEISVGCEACHGPGAAHVSWAHDRKDGSSDPAKGLQLRFDERRGITWERDPATGNPLRSTAPAPLRTEVETCGLCHARRGLLSEDWKPGKWLSDTHLVAPISAGLFHADGQMLDEVYNYGPFKQSRMFAAGVTCSDCHDPHSARLRASADGVCLQCHAPETYAAAAHHRHESADPALTCAACHMPERTYMVIDRRHDHSFRIPRPDLSVKLGTPNACNDCHRDQPAAWAAAAIEGWHGPDRKGFQGYAQAFHAAWSEQPDAGALLAAVASDANAPAFARASALSALTLRLSPAVARAAQAGLADPDPMVRIGALDTLQNLPAVQIWPVVSPLLADVSPGVRIKAVSLLAGVPTSAQPSADRERFERAASEFIAAQRLNADRPEARSALGAFLARRGLASEAEAEYRSALRLSPHYSPAAVNLADLYRQLRRDGEGESVLRAALLAAPRDAGLHHALGLTLVRLKRGEEALSALRLAAELAPDRARFHMSPTRRTRPAWRGSRRSRSRGTMPAPGLRRASATAGCTTIRRSWASTATG